MSADDPAKIGMTIQRHEQAKQTLASKREEAAATARLLTAVAAALRGQASLTVTEEKTGPGPDHVTVYKCTCVSPDFEAINCPWPGADTLKTLLDAIETANKDVKKYGRQREDLKYA